MKHIKGFPNYLIFENGYIYTGNPLRKRKVAKSDRGYYCLALYKNGKYYNRAVHRLVAETYIANPNNYPYVNHKDGNKTNNAVSNLEWVTQQMNIQHAHRTGLINVARGENHYLSKLTNADVKEIKKLLKLGKKFGLTQKIIASMFNVWFTTIGDINTNISWKHLN